MVFYILDVCSEFRESGILALHVTEVWPSKVLQQNNLEVYDIYIIPEPIQFSHWIDIYVILQGNSGF